MDFRIDKKDEYTLTQVLNDKLSSISSEGEKNVVLNLEACVYCDSFGLNAFLTASRLCRYVKNEVEN